MPSDVARFYSEGAADYREMWAPHLFDLSLGLIERLPIATASRVLDAACGVGLLLEELDRRCPPGVVFGADLSEGMLALAPAGVPRAVMDARSLAFSPASFDIVLLPFMLFHVPDPVSVLREARRAVRPGGWVASITWGENPEYEALTAWNEALEHFGAPPGTAGLSHHHLVDTPAKMHGLFAQAGLEPVETWTVWHELRMDPESFLEHRTGHGVSRRRFLELAEPVRAACLEVVRSRLAFFGPEAFVDRAEVIYVIGRPA